MSPNDGQPVAAWREHAFAVAVSLMAVASAFLVDAVLSVANLALLFLVAVVVVAVRTRMAAAVTAALLCFLAFNYFFTQPRYSFAIARADDVATAVLFLVAALTCSALATRLHRQVLLLQAANLHATTMQDLERAARTEAETERLRAALLSSVSHDLRSPLTAMIGAASSLSHFGDAMPRADRDALLDTIRIEGERLDRYIQNLLDMTRLGHGGLAIAREWIGVDEIVAAAVGRLHRHFPELHVATALAPDLPAIWVHPGLLEQAVFNVLENAARFSPAGEPVTITAAREDGPALRIDVSDRGPGIPEAERERIFDRFYSARRGDRGAGGTGLGLTICQGMIGAHGGSVVALPGNGGVGTLLRIRLPLHAPADAGEGR